MTEARRVALRPQRRAKTAAIAAIAADAKTLAQSEDAATVDDIVPDLAGKALGAELTKECKRFAATAAKQELSLVYLVRADVRGHGTLLKVGSTSKPLWKRLVALNSEYDCRAGMRPDNLKVLAVLRVARSGLGLEAKIHAALDSFRKPTKHRTGTWTELYSTDAVATFLAAADAADGDLWRSAAIGAPRSTQRDVALVKEVH